MLLKKLVASLVASVFVVGTACARDFRSADIHPNDYPTVMMVKRIAEIINKKTNGKYNIKVFANGSLGSEKDTLEQVKIGAIDMVRVGSAAFNNIAPESLVPSLPFVFRDVNHFRSTMHGSIGDRILASFEKHGFIGLAMLESGTRSIYAKKPVRNIADMKGLKVRVQQADLWIDLLKAMGGSPIPIPYAELYTALKTGLVDAAENNYPAYESSKHYEVANVYSETQHVLYYEAIVFSKKIWDTLSAEDQKIIRESVKEAMPYYIEEWTKREQVSKDFTIKQGVKYINDVNRDEFVKAMAPVWEKYTSTPETKALLKDIIEAK